jgi:glycosyltransferase involved in cell wall biosynthesis
MGRADNAATVGGEPRLVMVSWIRDNPRSRDLVQALGAQAVYMPWAWPGQSLARAFLGWLRSGLRTWRVVRRLPSGSVVVAMAPPVFCPLVALWAARRGGLHVAIDLHSGGLNDARWRWSFGLMRWAIRQAEAVIVTNPDLLEGQDTGATPVLVIQDPFWMGGSREAGSAPMPGRSYAVFPASGASDEPIEALAEAAALLKGELEIVVTGGHRVRPERPGMRLTGFLPADEFQDLMAHATVVLALSTREATMQRAAYEGLQLGRPLVCSDTRVLRRVLDDAAIFVENTGPAVAAGIREAVIRAEQLQAAGAAVRATIKAEAEHGLAQVHALAAAAPSREARSGGLVDPQP